MYGSTHIKPAYFRTYPWRARSWIGIGADRNSTGSDLRVPRLTTQWHGRTELVRQLSPITFEESERPDFPRPQGLCT